MTTARFVSSAIVLPDLARVSAGTAKLSYTPPNNAADRRRIHLMISQDLLDMLGCIYLPPTRCQSAHHGWCEVTPIRRYPEIEQRLFAGIALNKKRPRGRIWYELHTRNRRCHQVFCWKIFDGCGGVDDTDGCYGTIGNIEESGGRHGCFCF